MFLPTTVDAGWDRLGNDFQKTVQIDFLGKMLNLAD